MNITYITQTIEKTILEQHIGNHSSCTFQGIILLKNQKKLLHEYLYIGQYQDGLRLLMDCSPESSITMVLSADDINQTSLPDCSTHNVIVSTLDIFDLYNRLNIIVQNYLHWSHTLQHALCAGESLPQLLNTASGMIESPIYIINPGCRLIAGSNIQYFDEPLGNELRNQGSLSIQSIQKLHSSRLTVAQPNNYQKLFIHSIPYHVCEIHKHGRLLASILLAENPQKKEIDFYQLLIDFTEIITHTLLENLEMLLNQDQRFSAFLKELLNEQLTESAEIKKRLDTLSYPVHSFCCFVLIRQQDMLCQEIPTSVLLQHLQHIFPTNNMTVYEGDIVILHSQENRPKKNMNFDYTRLEALLERVHAYAGISNASRHLQRLRTLFTIASASIRLGTTLHRNTLQERIFSYENYSMYYIIDLCARQFIKEHHHNDLIYLVHPSIIKICRYDAEHKTNLRDVLFYYLLSGCSLNRTAQSMYMHRNTVLNKLNKISELTDIPLEDGYTRHRMIMSCLIMRYYEEYLHLNVRL